MPSDKLLIDCLRRMNLQTPSRIPATYAEPTIDSTSGVFNSSTAVYFAHPCFICRGSKTWSSMTRISKNLPAFGSDVNSVDFATSPQFHRKYLFNLKFTLLPHRIDASLRLLSICYFGIQIDFKQQINTICCLEILETHTSGKKKLLNDFAEDER
ncbi:hypothetical protein J6590_103577 [Homalodisca vitripennis]|nr:hypothetical protein J6590_103577 [Homalodisca vitripennis]